MIDRAPIENQMTIFEVVQESLIGTNHELVVLTKMIDWGTVESEIAECYCANNEHPIVPIGRMYDKKTRSDALNTLMAAAYIVRHWTNILASSLFVSCMLTLVKRLENVLYGNKKQSICRYQILAMVA